MAGILAADADFFIHSLTPVQFLGQTVYFTTTHVSILIVMTILVLLAVVVRVKIKGKSIEDKPTGILNAIELAVEMLESMVKGSMGKSANKYMNYIGTLFLFLLFSNISGLLGLRPPTADYGVTFPLGIITFVLIQYNNIKWNKTAAFTDLFKPLPFLFPINLIGELAVPFSISLRLFGNVLSGTVLMGLLYGLTPFLVQVVGIPAIAHIYCDLFSGAIQTYVFCMLTMVYVNDKIAD